MGMGFSRSANNILSDQAAKARLKDARVGKDFIIKRREQHMHIIGQTLQTFESFLRGSETSQPLLVSVVPQVPSL